MVGLRVFAPHATVEGARALAVEPGSVTAWLQTHGLKTSIQPHAVDHTFLPRAVVSPVWPNRSIAATLIGEGWEMLMALDSRRLLPSFMRLVTPLSACTLQWSTLTSPLGFNDSLP